MRPLAFMHPAQLLLGALVVMRGLAIMCRAHSLASLAADAVEWARQNRDLHRDLVGDAGRGELAVDEALADHVITAEEVVKLRAIFSEIKREAQTGKVE